MKAAGPSRPLYARVKGWSATAIVCCSVWLSIGTRQSFTCVYDVTFTVPAGSKFLGVVLIRSMTDWVIDVSVLSRWQRRNINVRPLYSRTAVTLGRQSTENLSVLCGERETSLKRVNILAMLIRATDDLIHPPSPVFRVTLFVSICWRVVYRRGKFLRYYNTLHLDLRLVLARALPESGCIISYHISLSKVFHPQQDVIVFRLPVRAFSTEAYTSTERCYYSARNWSTIGVQTITVDCRQTHAPTEFLHFTCGRLQLLTSIYSPRN